MAVHPRTLQKLVEQLTGCGGRVLSLDAGKGSAADEAGCSCGSNSLCALVQESDEGIRKCVESHRRVAENALRAKSYSHLEPPPATECARPVPLAISPPSQMRRSAPFGRSALLASSYSHLEHQPATECARPVPLVISLRPQMPQPALCGRSANPTSMQRSMEHQRMTVPVPRVASLESIVVMVMSASRAARCGCPGP